MARDYSAEYRARTQRAQERGFSGYGQERRVRRQITENFREQVSKGNISEVPKPNSEAFQAALKSAGEYTKTGRSTDKTQQELENAIIELDPDDWKDVYYSAQRAVYKKGKSK